ncbi:MAG TPA: TrkA family potassium uptake protein [Spirochaetia bacterium]|nr:TrkA family potassium uptake protein [Spirochaetia bacterium]
MKQFAIIGVSKFGFRVMEELSQIDCEILIIDKDREVIEKLKDRVSYSYIADVLNEETIRKLVPATVDAAIVDLGDRTEASILVTNYLKKIGVSRIIAKAETDEHGEILEIVGATHVIFPNREAAKRLTPMIAFSHLFNYLPISNGLIIAEIKVPAKHVGMSLIEADFRRAYKFNVIALRKADDEEAGYLFFDPDYRLQGNDVLLVAGNEEDLSGLVSDAPIKKRTAINRLFHNLMRRDRKGGR